MTSIRTRPRFRHRSKFTDIEVKNVVLQNIPVAKEENLILQHFEGHFTVHVALAERHFWSPHLNVNVDSTESGTLLRGRYGPAPSIWTIFTFGYTSLGLLFTFLGMYVGSVYLLGKETPLVWVLPFLFVGILSLWFAGQLGQKLGVQQTFKIHQFVERVLKEEIEVF